MNTIPFSALNGDALHSATPMVRGPRGRNTTWANPVVLLALVLVYGYRMVVPRPRTIMRLKRCDGAKSRGGFDPA